MPTLLLATLILAPQIGPVVPAGADAATLETALRVQESLERQDWASAAREAALLPKPRITLTWDDAKVPSTKRADFAKARDEAIAHWTDMLRGFEIRVAQGSDIAVQFVDALPPNEDSPGPAGATFFRGGGPGEPRLEAVIAVHRGESRLAISPREVHNEVLFAIGAYLGMERTPSGGGATRRHEGSYSQAHRVIGRELNLARELMGLAETLRAMATQQVQVTPARPRVNLDPTAFSHPKVTQGDHVNFSIQLTNPGNAPLTVAMIPDCRCITLSGVMRTLEPGQTGVVGVRVDTAEFPMGIDNNVIVYTNDPEQPLRRLHVVVPVEPRFRILREQPGRVVVVPDEGAKIELFLALPESSTMRLTGARVDGIRAAIAYERWSGTLADPELGQGPMPRQGYRVQVLTGLEIAPGRVPITIVLQTDDPAFPTLRHTLNIQRGIAALPSNLYLGEIGRQPTTATFVVSRPERGFRVLGVDVEAPYLKATVQPVRGDWEYRVTLTYDGTADFGELATTVFVRTDDPKQPRIPVYVSAIVR